MRTLSARFSIFGAVAAFAVGLPISAAASGGSGGTQTLNTVNVDSSSQLIWISGAATWMNPDGCGRSDIVLVQMSNTYYRDMLATLIAASVSGKSVGLWLNGCSNSPWGSAPVVISVALTN